MTIACPNCKSTNVPGTIFCVECGAQLLHSDTLVTQNISTAQVHEALASHPNQPQVSPQVDVTAWASLHLIDTGHMLPLVDRNEFTLGRITEGQPIMPDIDLSAYQAYASGVSRLHAILKRIGPHVIIMDLGAANGTYLNGKRLSPNVEQSINHGDIISLGKLKIQILLKS
ncbi:MAG: FHA domain-containing protein [Thermodesulfovibrionales bacterium]|nr:FHA domain-containing protein [Thermodesulfovibrionales bacterium]